MNKIRIGIGGTAANPPHLGHKYLIEKLLNSNRFDVIYWIPSGARADKIGIVSADHRVAMTLLTFPKEWQNKGNTNFSIMLDDVYGRNTPTIEVIENYKKKFPFAEIVWFTAVDLVVPQEKYGGKCEIQATWVRGEELYKNYKFLVFPRSGYVDPSTLNLPSNFEILDIVQKEISSTEIRRRILSNESIEGMVTSEVAKYIKKNDLYK